jgi:hypothetical protein
MENSRKLCFVRVLNMHLEITSSDVVEHFMSFCPGVHVELIWIASENGKNSSAELVLINYEPSKLHYLLRQRHEICGLQVDVLPSMFNEVKAPVSKLWIDLMKQRTTCDYVQFLKSNCRGVEVCQEGDEVYLQGHIDKVKAAMKSLQESDVKLLLSGVRDGSAGTQPATGNMSTTISSRDRRQKVDGEKRERKLANAPDGSSGRHQGTSGSSQQTMIQETDYQQHPTVIRRSNCQTKDEIYVRVKREPGLV